MTLDHDPVGEAGPLVRDVLLRDGSTLRLLAPTPADYDDIKEFFDGLSLESRYMRFHGYGRTDMAARAAAEAGGVDRFALIARHGGPVVAVAQFDGLREPRAAEVAFAVADDFRRRGAGTRMLEQLAEIAAERAITRFDAEVLSANYAMLGVFKGAGFGIRHKGSYGELTVSLDITPSEAVRARIQERDHFGAVAALRPILAPSSIAVVGVAATPGNLGRAVLGNIVAGGYEGVVTPVNRAGGVVGSMRVAHSLAELEVVPELVIITAAVNELLEFAADAAGSGAKALLLLPAGPEDDGEFSREQEQRLLEIVRSAGLRIVGPGSLGVVNTAAQVSLNATFSGARVHSGGLAIGSHAVALGLGLLGHAAARQLGVSVLVALGRFADVSTNDLLEWCEEDERTAAVLLYVESFGDPQRFSRIARSVSREKPILAIKGRRSVELTRSQAQSQTASALRGDAVVDALLQHAGVLRFRSAEELFDTAQLFASQPLPRGRRIAILSNAPGVATIAADACVTRGLEVVHASDARYPHGLAVGAGPHEYAARIGELLLDVGIDALMVYYVDQHDGDPEGVLDAISAASCGQPKPVVASVVRADGRLPSRSAPGVPNFQFPESCAAVLARATERRAWLSRRLGEAPHYPDLDPAAARELIDSLLAREPAGGWLSLGDAEALLATHGIPIAASERCRGLVAAIAAAKKIDAPVTLKANLAAPAHASEIDAVLLGLEGESAVRSGWRELERQVKTAGREWTGAIIQPLSAPGADVLVGAFNDHDLGALIAVALGGRHAGLDQAATFRLPPTTDIEADELIDACESVSTELNRFPDTAPLDHEALRELILRFALLLKKVPEIAEADLNPVRCTTNGCLVLDVRIRIERPRPVQDTQTW